MAIEILCQGCSRKLRVPDEHAGKQARCPECGTLMPIPASALPTRASAFPEMTSASPQPAPPDKWYLQAEDGRSYGPVPRAELDRWVAEGRVTARSILLREGETTGTPATQLYPHLASPNAAASGQTPFAASANPFADQPAAAASSVNPYLAPMQYGGRYQQAHRGGMILTFGILGVFCCFLFAIAAWAMGADDLKKMKLGLMDPSGHGLTQAGMIVGIISCALHGLLFVLNIIGAMAGGMR